MFSHLLRSARDTPGSQPHSLAPASWPTLACHLEATPWAGLYDESDDFIRTAVRGTNKTQPILPSDRQAWYRHEQAR